MSQTERKVPTIYSGTVSRRSGRQTVRVVLDYTTKHPKYGKILRRRTVAHVHDENNESQVGDLVAICKCRPLSKTKTWRLVSVLEKHK